MVPEFIVHFARYYVKVCLTHEIPASASHIESRKTSLPTNTSPNAAISPKLHFVQNGYESSPREGLTHGQPLFLRPYGVRVHAR